MLEKRSFNITKELAYLVNTFEDFSLVAQLKEEMDKLSYYFPIINKTI